MSALQWGAPWGLALVPLVLLVWGLALRRTSPARRWALHLTALSAGLFALAAADPRVSLRRHRLAVIALVDRSASVASEGLDAEARALRDEARAQLRRDDLYGELDFAGDVATVRALGPIAHGLALERGAVDAQETDLAGAVVRAAGALPDDASGRLVVLTDGATTRGDLDEAVAHARALGVAVDVVPVAHRGDPALQLVALRMPARASERETIDLRVQTRARHRQRVRLAVRRDGREISQTETEVAAGDDLVALTDESPGPGLHRYEVSLEASQPGRDDTTADNRAESIVRVRGASAALVLEGDPGAAAPFAETLRRGGFEVTLGGPNDVPATLGALARYDLVVLSDIAARALSPEQMQGFAEYVQTLGGGLLLFGGDRSYGPGGYAQTPIESLSPVRFDLRQERRRASLSQAIVIDYSGSMAAMAGNATKLALADEAAIRSASLLGPDDRLGVAHVDVATAWTVPMGRVTSMAAVARRLRGVAMGGGGILVPVALRDGYAALRGERTDLRHLLLFADGADAEEMPGCEITAAAAHRAGITTSVVSLGFGSDTPALERLAAVGHGRFYLVEDAQRLPTVFSQETVLATRASISERSFRPTPSAADPLLRDVDWARAPSLHGHVVTLAQPRASVLLTGPDRDPILALWSRGLGHVGAFTSDAKNRWGRDWIAWPEAQRLWVSLARRLARRDDPLVRVDTRLRDQRLTVELSAVSADGRADLSRSLSVHLGSAHRPGATRDLAPTGGGRYEAELALDGEGAYTLTVRDNALGAVVATAGVVSPLGREHRVAPDLDALRRLSAATQGRFDPPRGTRFSPPTGPRRGAERLQPLATALGMVALLAAVALRRLRLTVWPRAGSAAPKRVSRGIQRLSRALNLSPTADTSPSPSPSTHGPARPPQRPVAPHEGVRAALARPSAALRPEHARAAAGPRPGAPRVQAPRPADTSLRAIVASRRKASSREPSGQ